MNLKGDGFYPRQWICVPTPDIFLNIFGKKNIVPLQNIRSIDSIINMQFNKMLLYYYLLIVIMYY